MDSFIAWLELDDGSRLRLPPGGLMLGRSVHCDVILRSRRASREHALLRLGPRGPELIPLGRHPTEVNGRPVSRRVGLGDGDRIALPGAEARIRLSGAASGEELRGFGLQYREGPLLGLAVGPISVGGGEDDRLFLPQLPERAAVFRQVAGAVVVELGQEARIDGEPSPAGSIESLDAGQLLELGGERFVVHGEAPAKETTAGSGIAQRVISVQLGFRPTGGRLKLLLGERRHVVELSELRARLLAVLLSPPGDYAPGDFVPDELVMAQVWPGEPYKTRVDVNTLVHRVRKELLAAGLNPTEILVRARAGGSTCFRLGPETRVSVE